MATFAQRMIGAAKLDIPIYEEVEHDPNALGQAIAVVVLSAVASGLGALLAGPAAFVKGIVSALIFWFIWSGIIFVVGTKLMPEPQTKADMGQILRTLGFAASPGLLNVLGIIPILGRVVRLAVWLWLIVTMIVAVRQALDYTNAAKAVVVCLIGWIISVAISMLLLLPLGLGAAMF